MIRTTVKMLRPLIVSALFLGCTPPKPLTGPTPVASSKTSDLKNCKAGDVVSFAIQGYGVGCGEAGATGQFFEQLKLVEGPDSTLKFDRQDLMPFEKVIFDRLVPVSTDHGCAVKGSWKVGHYPPPEAEKQDLAFLTFTYDTEVTETGLTGSGSVLIELKSPEGEDVQPPCTERFTATGADSDPFENQDPGTGAPPQPEPGQGFDAEANCAPAGDPGAEFPSGGSDPSCEPGTGAAPSPQQAPPANIPPPGTGFGG